MAKVQWYNFTFDNFPVKFPAMKRPDHSWQRITGLQIGDCFIGVIKGKATNNQEHPDATGR